ncbi:asparagine synthase (glutamine-hydrolyzing) [Shouchella hunanensis]|uniref:asparagine synthase (glutamine-hydrolyzing) n=1 Tax=Shouchella hunanensis TaxID=766894 RepID=A0ABY7W5A7_9BACI|nr:asparagine synthase (glutamine-hydrolyzing) [Shouchella hunanensis]WDF04069.1 asparagine synthase (glutamine-hydrolyzing) [Shouchella hunanensis]
MCGFIGELLHKHNETNHASDQTWNEALEVIHHRGPDQTGEYKDGFVRLGFKRLSIIDLENGSQPFSYEDDRYQMVFNGEIYNYIELREALQEQGVTFHTHSDTEVLIALFAHEGKDMIKKLRGMFAFAIWDTEEKTLFCGRDRFGIKPFYYMRDNGRIHFGSEQKSLMPYIQEIEVNTESLQHYATFQYVPEPNTLTTTVEKLLPGHCLTIDQNLSIEVTSYSDRSFYQQSRNQSLESLVTETKEVLINSVEKHMRSDVPVGSFLSSGIDSTAIVAMAKEQHPDLLTFTVGFETQGYSEIDIAQDSADKLGVRNISKIITPEEFLHELPKIMWHMDEPVADPAAVPLYFVAKEASKHVKVVLSGEGADELFGGYRIYREPLDLKFFDKVPKSLHPALNRLAHRLPSAVKGRGFLLRGTTPIEERYVGNAFIFNEEEKRELFHSYNSSHPYTNVTRPLYDAVRDYDDSTKMQYVDMHTWLASDILVKADRMTMAHSLELRVPFLDKEVFEFARALQTDFKLANKTTKFVLREAMKEIVPESIVSRKKLGFPVPIRVWLKDELYSWAEQTIKTSGADEYFNKDYLLRMLEDHRQGKADYSRKLWTVLCYMMWHDLHLAPTNETAIKNVM